MLCLPIFGGPQSSEYPKGKVLGVFAIYNKKSEPDQDTDIDFTDNDIVSVRKLLVMAGQGWISITFMFFQHIPKFYY